MRAARVMGLVITLTMTRALDFVAAHRAMVQTMRFGTYFYAYFWFSRHTGGGETSA